MAQGFGADNGSGAPSTPDPGWESHRRGGRLVDPEPPQTMRIASRSQ